MQPKQGTKAYHLIVEEKGYSAYLSTIGKIACFAEVFYGIKLNDNDIKEIIPIEEPTKTQSFQDGYDRGKALVDNGFSKEHYLEFYKNIRAKLKEKLDAAEFSKKVK